ncbi:MAG: DNA polymerase I [Gammaproteobacteria bacterium]|jgi:DNA polymerase-1|nr:DNA polymerase I [Gammaproteobacteria bacterium]
MPSPRRLVLIDGNSYLYRAFHALPPLSTSQGQPTGAILGFLNMLRQVRRVHSPDLIAVVMDAPGPTFRDELYAHYKANREAMPDDLQAQIPPLMEMVRALGITLLREPGVEADDVIGTLAKRACTAGLETLIATSDKDMSQLVNEHIRVFDGISGRMLDPAGVLDKFGVPPERIIDWLTLVGDSSDNIPGVPSVGPKTAAKWLTEYGSLDALVARADEIKGKVGEKLRAHLGQLPLSRQLATIHCDVPLAQKPEDMQPGAPDLEALTRLSAQLEIRSLRKGIEPATDQAAADKPAAEAAAEAAAGVPARGADPVARNYQTISSAEQFAAWFRRIEGAALVGFDTETTSLDYMQAEIVGLSFALDAGDAAYLPLAHRYVGAPDQLDRSETLARLKGWLENPSAHKVGHHLKYDAHVLANHGIRLAGMRHDTMLESYVLDSTATRHDLDSAAKKYLGVDTIHFEDVAGKGAKQISFDQVSVEQASEYAAEDADITLRLHHELWPRLAAVPGLIELYENIEQPLVPVLTRMEETGVLVDTRLLRTMSGEFAEKMAALEKAAHEEAGHPFNLNSPKQLQAVLFDELKLPIRQYTPTRQPSTNEDALAELADEYRLPRLILDYRSLSKLKSTYTDKLPGQVCPRTGRIHTSYHQAVAATGRLSSSDPNLQNIPIRSEEGRRIRQAFIARKGCVLLAADYSQIELRIMAHLSGDEGLLKAFAEDRDIHQATAAEVFGTPLAEVTADQRRSAKAINFGLIYGMSAFGLARQLGISREDAQRYVELYFLRYPGVKAYMERTRAQAREQGYVETVFGRRLYLPDISARQAAQRQYAERSAINAPMQGTAADIIKRAMISTDAWLQQSGSGAQLIMQVHDELVLEVPAENLAAVRSQVVALMSGAAELRVPLRVDAGHGANWDEAH